MNQISFPKICIAQYHFVKNYRKRPVIVARILSIGLQQNSFCCINPHALPRSPDPGQLVGRVMNVNYILLIKDLQNLQKSANCWKSKAQTREFMTKCRQTRLDLINFLRERSSHFPFPHQHPTHIINLRSSKLNQAAQPLTGGRHARARPTDFAL